MADQSDKRSSGLFVLIMVAAFTYVVACLAFINRVVSPWLFDNFQGSLAEKVTGIAILGAVFGVQAAVPCALFYLSLGERKKAALVFVGVIFGGTSVALLIAPLFGLYVLFWALFWICFVGGLIYFAGVEVYHYICPPWLEPGSKKDSDTKKD